MRLTRAVIILTRKAADCNDGCIGKRTRLLNQFAAQNRLPRFAGRRARVILRADVFCIKAFQRLKDLDFSFILLDAKPLCQRPDIRDRRIAASSAALNIIRLCFSEHRHAASALQRKCIVFVFEQNHALCRRSARQINVLLTAGYAASILAQGCSGHKPNPLPFLFHRKNSSVHSVVFFQQRR